MGKNILRTLLIAMIGGFFSILIFTCAKDPNTINNANAATPLFSNNLNTNLNYDFTVSAEKSLYAVVHVKTKSQKATQYYSNPFDFFFGGGVYEYTPPPVLSSGSGVIISDDGYIVTNNHVIDKSNEIEVILNDKRSYTAELIGTDPTTDLAVLKIKENNLAFLDYGNSDKLKVGEWVMAVGNPFNLTSTVTAGIVSAKARNINILSKNFAIESFIQTDAAVNPGNSGGALVNIKGDLVGINTAIASKTGSYVGYSFAIPVSIVKKIVKDIIDYGEAQRAFLGVSIIELNAKNIKQLGLKKIEGIYIANVNDGSSAMKAGIKKGDVITKVNNFTVNTIASLLEQISKYRPSDEINLEIKRNGNIKNIDVVLQNINGTTGLVKNEEIEFWGATLKTLPNKYKNKFNLENGVIVLSVKNGKIDDLGIRKGFVITHINRDKINSPSEIENIISNTNKTLYITGTYPNESHYYYEFKIN